MTSRLRAFHSIYIYVYINDIKLVLIYNTVHNITVKLAVGSGLSKTTIDQETVRKSTSAVKLNGELAKFQKLS